VEHSKWSNGKWSMVSVDQTKEQALNPTPTLTPSFALILTPALTPTLTLTLTLTPTLAPTLPLALT
jgi:hypothetical protein